MEVNHTRSTSATVRGVENNKKIEADFLVACTEYTEVGHLEHDTSKFSIIGNQNRTDFVSSRGKTLPGEDTKVPLISYSPSRPIAAQSQTLSHGHITLTPLCRNDHWLPLHLSSRRFHPEVRAEKLFLHFNLGTNGKVTSEPPPTAGQAGCLQGQDRSVATLDVT
ncbi:hypothetical protein J6590_047572 [Homalodisca vitripennis]|nr:hypothetical protein J6590_047572 [Homalodisca vitripennis]